MNKPRLKFEYYKYPLPLMKRDFKTEYDRETAYSKIFGKEVRIHVATYYKAALNGMQEAVRSKGRIFEFDSPEYKEYYGLDEVFRNIYSEETNIKWDGEFND